VQCSFVLNFHLSPVDNLNFKSNERMFLQLVCHMRNLMRIDISIMISKELSWKIIRVIKIYSYLHKFLFVILFKKLF
jgi:hypothetical protein